MYILSAKHHLVPLTKVLAPYDKTLKEMPKDEKEAWGEKVQSQMKAAGINTEKDKFIFLTGSEYMKPLPKFITHLKQKNPIKDTYGKSYKRKKRLSNKNFKVN